MYQNAAGQWQLATCSAGGTAAQSGFGTRYGIALNNVAAAGQPLTAFVPTVGQSSQINVGATTVQGTVYIISPNNPGAIAPLADWITANQYLTYLGYAIGTTGVLEMLTSVATNIKHS
ncbi:MAG: hypothetical protein KGJ09_09240 [Candidatus Omnitrophica bacterium]|nr:hypothetical protein [Candidatus Omnitrophota bacterium]